MGDRIQVKPLPYKTRQRTFGLLFLVFLVSLPFLYLYATGYRYDIDRPTNLVSTGGIYVAVERTGADIYIDNELVRETRTFRKAFYAQSLDVGTHRVHVQKDGYHTWVKELPVSKHLVTEAEAFNLPLVPQVRVISKFVTSTGTPVVRALLTNSSSTNELFATTTLVKKGPLAFVENEEFKSLMTHFGTTSTSTKDETTAQHLKDLIKKSASSTPEIEVATTTLVSGGVKLSMQGEDLIATWVGSFEDMPYYFCAPDFEPYVAGTIATTTDTVEVTDDLIEGDDVVVEDGVATMHPIQTVPKDVACDPTILIDHKGQEIKSFDFFLGSTDFVVVVLQDGIYVVEVDDRAWQNIQPLIQGSNLHMYIENGNMYVYDGELIYQMIITTE
ncbi:MAG: PEGA domain-containing protein [Minisyncoccia bacterium]